MHTAAGELRWHKPLAYQEVNGSRKLIACDYVREGERVAFTVGAYDPSKPLFIDPELVYSTFLGGSGDENLVTAPTSGIAVDAVGNAYITGSTSSLDFPTKRAFQKTLKAVSSYMRSSQSSIQVENSSTRRIWGAPGSRVAPVPAA